MGYVSATVIENQPLTRTVSKLTFKLKYPIKQSQPGNYVMVWLPGIKEAPFSVYSHESTKISLIIEAVGPLTKKLINLKNGEKVGIRGPYGNSFTLRSNLSYMLVAGGSGTPPIFFALNKLKPIAKDITYLIGAHTSDELFLIDEAKLYSVKVFVATDDGSLGFKGFVTQLANDLLKKEKIDMILTCGPEPMIKTMYELAVKYNVMLEASMSRIIKCSLGFCGSCVLEPKGYRVCTDGPVFNKDQLSGIKWLA
ncbi:MAG: dihydroorotate dehydrogenase electron transfer subunit [Thermoprotei archaeon]